MLHLTGGVKPVVQRKYLHMMPEDTAIWTRFLRQGQFLPDLVWYDVHVGKGIHVSDGQPDWLKKMTLDISRKRIDIVARCGLDYWIIEAKPAAGIVALGQVLYYSTAFALEYEHAGRIIPAVVTDVVDPDLVQTFRLGGVVIFESGLE